MSMLREGGGDFEFDYALTLCLEDVQTNDIYLFERVLGVPGSFTMYCFDFVFSRQSLDIKQSAIVYCRIFKIDVDDDFLPIGACSKQCTSEIV